MFVAVKGLTEAPGGESCVSQARSFPREIRISKGDAALSALPTMASKLGEEEEESCFIPKAGATRA